MTMGGDLAVSSADWTEAWEGVRALVPTYRRRSCPNLAPQIQGDGIEQPKDDYKESSEFVGFTSPVSPTNMVSPGLLLAPHILLIASAFSGFFRERRSGGH